MSGADWALLGLIGLAVALAIRAIRRGGSGGCGGDCARCRWDCREKPAEGGGKFFKKT